MDYRIFVIEQSSDDEQFNRAALMNAGFMEANKFDRYFCFVFHDVDLLPEDDRWENSISFYTLYNNTKLLIRKKIKLIYDVALSEICTFVLMIPTCPLSIWASLLINGNIDYNTSTTSVVYQPSQKFILKGYVATKKNYYQYDTFIVKNHIK